MRALVTGASGFIGSHLCRRLVVDGWEVRAVVRRPQSTDGRLQFVVCDLLRDCVPPTALVGVDVVVHLAAQSVTTASCGQAFGALRRLNTDATSRLAEIAVRREVPRFVFISSAKVHGEVSCDRAFTESDAPRAISAYAQSKLDAETELRKLTERSATDLVVLRPPLVYGAGVGGTFAKLLLAVSRGWPLPLASINNRRSLIYVDNLVDLIVLCMRHPGALRSMFLVSDGEDVSTPELVRRLAKALGRPARLVRFPPAFLEGLAYFVGTAEIQKLTRSFQVDSREVRTSLNWTPPCSMDHGFALAWRSRHREHSSVARR
jgi:nucleoside-diphosphate-sugar epimerase